MALNGILIDLVSAASPTVLSLINPHDFVTSLQHVPGDKSSNWHVLLVKSLVLGNCDEHCTVGLHFSPREHCPRESSTEKKGKFKTILKICSAKKSHFLACQHGKIDPNFAGQPIRKQYFEIWSNCLCP